jgi:hypothetical protein
MISKKMIENNFGYPLQGTGSDFVQHIHTQKNGEALKSLMGTLAQPHSRSNSEKKTSHNIEQHLNSFDIN